MLGLASNKRDPPRRNKTKSVPSSYKCNSNSCPLLINSVHYSVPAFTQTAPNSRTKSVPLTLSDQLYFLFISEVWSILHHRAVGGEFRIKNVTLHFHNVFGILLFFILKFALIICIVIFNEVSNFRSRVLTSYK